MDQIYDRELFRVLADANHLRRVWSGNEAGDTLACVKRIVRSVVRPKSPERGIEVILAEESAVGFRSTFFLLEDRTFNRHGGRYRYGDRATRAIVSRILSSGSEVAVHGAYHAFNSAHAYRDQARSFRNELGVEPKGIRNHFLRLEAPRTWEAQREAGFGYDATFGFNNVAGIRDGRTHPFFPLGASKEAVHSFVALPLTIMDSALFRHMGLAPERARAHCLSLVEQIREVHGLLSLSWHNNYFDEPEYEDWQTVYVHLLEYLRQLDPWCTTGAEIADWWRRRAGVQIIEQSSSPSSWRGVLRSSETIRDVAVRVEVPGGHIVCDLPELAHVATPEKTSRLRLQFPLLKPGCEVPLAFTLT